MLHKTFLKAIVLTICLLPGGVRGVEFFPLEQVQLFDGPFKHAQQVNLDYLLKYDVDRLLAPYRREAGLEPKGESYPNWIGLDGHIGGHYLSAMAIYTAATGNEECKRRMDYMVDELDKCQQANGNGYVGGVPDSKRIFSSLHEGNLRPLLRAWVPWYNLHKTFAGLRDAWVYGKNPKAKEVLIKLADWCCEEVSELSDEQMQRMLDQEHGGMNEVLADVSVITGDAKYLELAKRFSHRQLLDPMAKHRDTLDNKHANTQVPKAVGFQRIAALAGDDKFAEAARFFWETVVNNRTLAFGGNSRREHFPSAEACVEFIEEREGPESCNTYNMLKLTKGLFAADPQARYADYYERALYNHILSTQHPEHGGYVYFTPVRPRHYRVYSAPNQAMWCCVGTGMENHGKYGEFIYSHQDDTLFVNLFIASELNWKQKGVRIRQQTRFPDEPKTTLTILTDKPVEFALNVRHPRWVRSGRLTFKLGDETWSPQSEPSSYVTIDRRWQNGDRLEVTLPMRTTVETMPNVPDYAAIRHGPIILAAKTGAEDLQGLVADDGRWSHIAHGQLLPLDNAPMLVAEMSDIPEKITPVDDAETLQFKAEALIRPETFKDLILEPFFRIHDARYIMYWQVAPPRQYERIQAALKAKEQQRLALDRRTIDRVIPGEQQPEADHNLQHENSETGIWKNRHLRHVAAPGWFSYELRVQPDKPILLYVLYWGHETGRRTFDILIDGQKLTTENTVEKWNKDEFISVEYPVPAEIVKEKERVTVTFKPHPGHYAGGIFDLRIVETDQ